MAIAKTLEAILKADVSDLEKGMNEGAQAVKTLEKLFKVLSGEAAEAEKKVNRSGQRIAAGLKRTGQLAGKGFAQSVRMGFQSTKMLGGGAMSMFGKMGDGLVSVGKGIGSKLAGGVSMGLAAAGAGITAFTGWGVKLAADAESAQVAFTTMLGNADKAKTLLAEFQKFAAETPFETSDLRAAGRSLLSFGVDLKNVMPMIKTLGDVASGSQSDIKDLALIYGKTLAKGKFELEQGNQLAERGIPIYSTLAKQLGVAQGELMKMISAGKVSAADVKLAFETMSGSGGIFENAMKKQSTTLLGLWSSAQDSLSMLATDLGTQLIEIFDMKGAITGFAGLADTIRSGINDWKPYIIAFRDVWTAAMESILYFTESTFGRITELVGPLFESQLGNWGSSWSEWGENFLYTLWGLEYGWAHFGEYFWLGITKLQLGAVTLWEDFANIFTNFLPSVFNNFGDSLYQFFVGLAANVAEVITEIWDYITTLGDNEMEFDWTPILIDEVAATLERQESELEKSLAKSITDQEANMQSGMDDFIQGKMDELKKQSEAVKNEIKMEGEAAVKDETDAEEKAAAASDKKKSKDLNPAALTRGSAAAFSAINAARKNSDPLLKEAKKQTKAAEQTAKNTEKMANNQNGGLQKAPI